MILQVSLPPIGHITNGFNSTERSGKANPNSADEQGHVAINDAVAKDRFDLVTKLLEYGALVPWLDNEIQHFFIFNMLFGSVWNVLAFANTLYLMFQFPCISHNSGECAEYGRT